VLLLKRGVFMSIESYCIRVSLPEYFVPIFRSMGLGTNLDDSVKLSLAIGLFTGKTVSLAKAAELAGLSLADFIAILQGQNIPWMEYTDEARRMDEIAIDRYVAVAMDC
jgi:predicted HTH domain antitoxin